MNVEERREKRMEKAILKGQGDYECGATSGETDGN